MYSLFYSYLFTSEKLSLGEVGGGAHNTLYFRKKKIQMDNMSHLLNNVFSYVHLYLFIPNLMIV